MVTKFSIPCSFSGQVAPVDFYIGNPNRENHPINFQAKWLSSERGGQVPQQMMDSIQKVKIIADENNISFEELCTYAINLANGYEQQDIPKYNKLFIEYDKKFNEQKK